MLSNTKSYFLFVVTYCLIKHYKNILVAVNKLVMEWEVTRKILLVILLNSEVY